MSDPIPPHASGAETGKGGTDKGAVGADGRAGIVGNRDVFGTPPSSRSMVRYIRPTLWGLLIVYVVIFLLLNRAPTQINFLFFSAQAPLFIALLIVLIIGIVVGGGGMILHGRRQRASDKARSGKQKK